MTQTNNHMTSSVYIRRRGHLSAADRVRGNLLLMAETVRHVG